MRRLHQPKSLFENRRERVDFCPGSGYAQSGTSSITGKKASCGAGFQTGCNVFCKKNVPLPAAASIVIRVGSPHQAATNVCNNSFIKRDRLQLNTARINDVGENVHAYAEAGSKQDLATKMESRILTIRRIAGLHRGASRSTYRSLLKISTRLNSHLSREAITPHAMDVDANVVAPTTSMKRPMKGKVEAMG